MERRQSKVKVLVIGDSCEDVFIYGNITRVAPEAPVPVVVPVRQESNPGMAGNVVANLEALGAEVDLITNEDPIRKIRYVDERYNQMVLRVDENDSCKRYNGVYKTIEYDAIIISDYNKGFLTQEDIAAFSKRAECPVFLDTKKFLGNWCNDIDYIKINSLEHEKNIEKISEHPLLKDKLIVTKGEHGCEYKNILYPTVDVPVKDVSGAGDTFIAGLVYEYIISNDIKKAIKFAQECTTIVVQKPGVATI